MRKPKIGKSYIAGIAAVIFAVAGLSISTAYAANDGNTQGSSSLTIDVGDTGTIAEELAAAELKVMLYKVAEANSAGTYTACEGYEDLKLENAVPGAEAWSETSEKAAECAAEKEPDVEIVMTEGEVEVGNLSNGIYLVMVEDVITECYEYSFSPCLVFVPDNPSLTLKSEQNPRYGQLEIQKTLTSYNTSLKEVTFVFRVEAVDADGVTVYSNVVSTTHSAAGTKKVVIDHIQAGATVTVTEVYSGASYKVSGSQKANTVIVADDIVSVAFSNIYDDELVPGYGVTNHFELDENNGWKWSKLNDNSVE